MTSRLRRWLVAHPVTALLLWFFTVGQALSFTPVIGSSLGRELPVEPFTAASTWVGLLLPAGFLTWICDGRHAVRALVFTLIPARRQVPWLVGILLVVPATSLAIAGAVVGLPDALTLTDTAAAYLSGTGLQTLVHLLTNNLWEEVAWTGFVQARLQQRWTPSRAVLVTAPLFALQHLALIADNSALAALTVALALLLLALPYRAALGWLFNHTHSLLLVGVAHACGDAMATGSVLGDGFLPILYGRGVGPMHLFAFAVLGTAVWIGTRGRLGYRGGLRL